MRLVLALAVGIASGCVSAEAELEHGRDEPSTSVGPGAGEASGPLDARDPAPVDAAETHPSTVPPPTRPEPLAYTDGRRRLVEAGVPDLAAKAYLNAAARVGDVNPNCVVPPEVIAAFGRQESNHGRVAEWDETGRSTTILRGYANTGDDTDEGALDGDVDKDWAVGAMQFIPTTWKAYAQDGDGDGIAEPGNFFDAALSAAWHICDIGGSFPSPSYIASQWASFDASFAVAEARFKEQKRLYDHRFERHTVLAFQVMADPDNEPLAAEFERWPHPGKPPEFTPPPLPAGAATLVGAAERYYGPEGEVRDDYVASIGAGFRAITSATGDAPYGELDRVRLV